MESKLRLEIGPTVRVPEPQGSGLPIPGGEDFRYGLGFNLGLVG